MKAQTLKLLAVGGGSLWLGALMGTFLVGCARSEAPAAQAVMEAPAAAEPPAPPESEALKEDAFSGGMGISGITGSGGLGIGGRKMAAGKLGRTMAIAGIRGAEADGVLGGVMGGELGGEQEAAAPSRAWFPETFLFEPRVVTDAAGEAQVPVRVPDRLTRWRVLALAHSRGGAQAGAVATLTSTLPTYVDPVLPPFLRAGDVVRMPVQVVNTTDAAVARPLEVRAEGAVVERGARTVQVPARGSAVEYVVVRAERSGPVVVRAVLGSTDAVVRDFEVWPAGRQVAQVRGGTLAAPRTLELEGVAEALPGTEKVRLLVFPGALGVLRSELAAAAGRGEGVAGDAYALLLAGRAPGLLEALGEKADAEALRTLATTVGQRVLRAGRAPDVPTAALLVEAALAHPGNPVLARLGERLAGQVAAAQRPDGTCQGEDGWTLQRLLVATADCARAVRAAQGTPEGKRRAAAFSVRAMGAVERHLGQVKDGYTAAALVAGGVVTGGLQQTLRKQVLEALQKREDGAVYLPVGPGVVRADGQVPSESEATALAVLALEGDQQAPLADLGTGLLGGYRPQWGWGEGRANLAGLQAALVLFRDPLPAQVRVVLERDGKVVTEGAMDAKAMREVLALGAPVEGSAGKHTWSVRAEPAVPGLGFSLELEAYVPWKAGGGERGLELAVQAPVEARVGRPVEVGVQAAAPSGLRLVLRYGLPAGVQVDRPSLEALVTAGKVSSFEVEDGTVSLKLPARPGPEPFSARFRVVPTLAGTLQAGASSLAPEDRPELAYYMPSAAWVVR